MTGQCHLLKGLVFRLELAHGPPNGRCDEKDGDSPHVLCSCELQVELRFRHLTPRFIESSQMKPIDWHEVSIKQSAALYWECRTAVEVTL